MHLTHSTNDPIDLTSLPEEILIFSLRAEIAKSRITRQIEFSALQSSCRESQGVNSVIIIVNLVKFRATSKQPQGCREGTMPERFLLRRRHHLNVGSNFSWAEDCKGGGKGPARISPHSATVNAMGSACAGVCLLAFPTMMASPLKPQAEADSSIQRLPPSDNLRYSQQ